MTDHILDNKFNKQNLVAVTAGQKKAMGFRKLQFVENLGF